MTGIQLTNYINSFKDHDIPMTKESINKFLELFRILDQLIPTGEDNFHEFWFCLDRDIKNSMDDYEDCLEEGIVSSKEEYYKVLEEEYPEEIIWFKVSTCNFGSYYSLYINGDNIFHIDMLDEPSNFFDLTDLADLLIEKAKMTVDMVKVGDYMSYLNMHLPLSYRFGVVDREVVYAKNPDIQKKMFQGLTQNEVNRFLDKINTQKELTDNMYNNAYLVGTVEKLSVQNYLDVAACALKTIHPETSDMSSLEVYQRYADNRDGGFLCIDKKSQEVFDKWYNGKYDFGGEWVNDSHKWEISRGSSLTRIHLFVRYKEKKGYYFVLSGSKYCCLADRVKMYLALSDAGYNVFLSDADVFYDIYSKKGKIGIIPQIYKPFEMYLSSSSFDKNVVEFYNFNLHNSDVYYVTKDLEKDIEWMPLEEILPKT